MTKIVKRIIMFLSISLNIAFALHFFLAKPYSPTPSMQLTLTDSQSQKLSQIRKEQQINSHTLKKEIQLCQTQMLALLKVEPVNKKELYLCIDKIGDLQKKIQQNTVEEILQMKGVLNTHQCNCLIDGMQANVTHSTEPCTKGCCTPQKKSDTLGDLKK